MSRRFVASTGVAGIVAVVALLGSIAIDAQGPTANARATTPAKKWTLARTPDGQPDLQGFWTNTTYTPLERPEGIDREFFTQEEALEQVKRLAAAESEQTEPGTILDVHYDFTQFGLDRSQGGGALNLRTSMIVDPANGRLPPMTAAGAKRNADRAAARKRAGAATDAVQNQSLSVRCILMDRSGPPMLAGAYNNNYQIVQTPGYAMILVEMLHDSRIIPLDGRPHLPTNVRQYMGSYRGRWEGDTLVVETTNFTDKTAFRGSSQNMRLTERFTRVDEDTIVYRFTIDDPDTWTRPWTAETLMKKTVGPLFEHACHEGNYGLYNTLAGARAEEKKAAEEATRKGSK
jgi:hypothetical protein